MSYYDDEDELDIRVRSGRVSPQPAVYPEHRYFPAAASPTRRAPARHRPPPIHPPRAIRRASTLPVRFDDEREIEREVRRRRQRDSGRPDISPERIIPESTGHESDEAEAIELSPRRGSVEEQEFRREPVIISNRSRHIHVSRSTRSRSRSRSRSPVRNRSRSPQRSRSISPRPGYERERNRRNPQRLREERERLAEELLRERELRERINKEDDYLAYRSRDAYLTRDRYVGADDYLEKEGYSFLLSRHTKSSWSRDSTLGSVSDASEPETTPAPQVAAAPQVGKVLRVWSSKYTGDGSLGGLQSAELTVMDDDQGSRKGAQPVFRWIQFEDLSMNFDRFEDVWTGCKSISSLTDSQNSGISKILTRVRRKFGSSTPLFMSSGRDTNYPTDKPMQARSGTKVRFMVPGVLQGPLLKDPRDNLSRSGTVTWICLPYFCLQKYSGSISGLPASSHPMKTLLQARFSLTRKERDMQQAACHLLGTPQDHCFHIAQIWCLILDDDLLITCARTPIPSLTGKSISLSPAPKYQQLSRIRRSLSKHLLVSCDKLLWSFPLEECQTWFAFVSHFWEYWPRRLQFSNGKVITPDMWPKLIVRAAKTTVRIELHFRPSIKEPAKGILLYSNASTVSDETTNSEGDLVAQETPGANEASSSTPQPASTEPPNQEIPSTSGDQSTLHPDTAREPQCAPRNRSSNRSPSPGSDVLSKDFHVFTWLNEKQPTTWPARSPSNEPQADIDIGEPRPDGPFSIDQESMKADLKEIDHFLKHRTGFEERLIYKTCPPRTRTQIYELIKKDEKDVTGFKGDTLRQRKAFEDEVEILNKAESLLQFFIPSSFEGPTVGKFWGALFRLLGSIADVYRISRNSISPRDAREISFWLTETSRRLQLFKDIFSHANSAERASIQIPEEFPRAWLHILMSLVFCSNEKYMAKFEEQSRICTDILDDGMRKVVQNLMQKSLLEYSVFKPWELISLINFQLLGDIKGQSLDTSDTYFEYLSSVESAIEANPLDRAHQDKISCLKQEISVIIETLVQQRRIINFAQPFLGGQPLEIEDPILRTSRSRYPGESYLVPAASTRPPYYSHGGTSYSRADATIGSTYRSRARQSSSYYEREDYDRDVQQSGLYLRPLIRPMGPPRTPGSQLDPTDPNGVQGLLVQDSQALIDRKIQEFREIVDRATDLEKWNIQKIDYNRDRQEAAIYAFTIVTIIFLPLSSVASILGMNVNDIRNMEINQWVFWAVALPLTVIIITLCLIWAGELENFWLGFKNLWGKGKTGRRYARGGGGYYVLNPRPQPPQEAAREIIYDRIYNVDDEYDERPSYHRSRSRSLLLGEKNGW
ncbi:uncharacterized protein PAC_17568 [Phialocephala subalpina]|uniref:Uncharacterized protein n=1 Tax=Phialocephala subalpina TaxID=576137 RepID=A0A1L7XRN7_9HELO|nr:uncharacterized protein PAC_17568 [Phialocephala subalpina]